MNIKSQHNGFSLIEAMIALTMVGLIMGVLFNLYGNVSFSTRKATSSFARVIALKNFIAEIEQKLVERGNKVEKFEKIDENLGVKFIYRQEPILEKSSLKKVPHIILEKITSEWTLRGKTYQDRVTMIRFKPEQQEQHEQKK